MSVNQVTMIVSWLGEWTEAADWFIFLDRVMLDCDADKLSLLNHQSLLSLSLGEVAPSKLDSVVLCVRSKTS